MTSDLLARIATGDSPRREMLFSFGRAVEAFSIGTSGNWQISGDQVRPLHAFVHFDGSTIFALSTADEQPAVLNGVQLPRTWTALPVPAVITLGGVTITFGATSDEDVTRLIHMPSSVRERPSPPPPRPLLPIPPSARAASVAHVPARPSPPPLPRPGSGPMFRDQPPSQHTTVFVQSERARSLSAISDAPSRDDTTVRSNTRLRQAQLRRIALGVVGAVLIGLVSFSFLRGQSAAAPPAAGALPRASEALRPGSAAARVETEVAAANPVPDPKVPADMAPVTAPAQGAIAPTMVVTARSAALAVDPAAEAALPATLHDARPALSGDDDRAAADAVARGESDVALALYTKLAATHPQQPAFAAARQILESKARAREGAR